MPTANRRYLTFDCDIVESIIYLILGLNVLINQKIRQHLDDLSINHKDWNMPLLFDDRYVWIRHTVIMHCTRAELCRLYSKFKHPSAEKLYSLLKRIKIDNIEPRTLQNLEDIQSRCEIFAIMERKQLRF